MQTPSLTVAFADGAVSANVTQALSAELLSKLEVIIPAEASSKDVALGCDVSQIQAVLIVATAVMTIKTQSAIGADVDTIVLAANKPILWQYGCGTTLAHIFTADFASLHVDSTPGGTLTIWILSDSTP
jgi:hypothetical protein